MLTDILKIMLFQSHECCLFLSESSCSHGFRNWFQISPFHHDTRTKKESIQFHSFTSFTLRFFIFKCVCSSLDLSGSRSGAGRVTGGVAVKAFIALHSARTPQTFSHSRHFDPWESGTSVTNGSNEDGTEVPSLAGGQNDDVTEVKKKKDRARKTEEAKGRAQTQMRTPSWSIHQDCEGQVRKTFESLRFPGEVKVESPRLNTHCLKLFKYTK